MESIKKIKSKKTKIKIRKKIKPKKKSQKRGKKFVFKKAKKVKKIKKIRKIRKKPARSGKKEAELQEKLDAIIKRGRMKGFVTFAEILYYFPRVEEDIEMLENIYQRIERKI